MKLVLLTALGVGGATILGSIIGFVFKNITHKFSDLVLSGHAHGGIVRLPFTDGVFSHNGLFPTHTAGLYEENNSLLFVTRGLGSSAPACRLFNRPEVAVLTLHNHE